MPIFIDKNKTTTLFALSGLKYKFVPIAVCVEGSSYIVSWRAASIDIVSLIIFLFLSHMQPSWKQSEVFQLDPLTGEDAPDIPDTIKQHAVSDTLLGVVQDVLNGPELNPILSPVIGDYQVEVAQVHVLSCCFDFVYNNVNHCYTATCPGGI